MTAVNTPCTKTKDEAMSQHLNNANVQESNSIPLLELDTINISPIKFNSDESLHKNTEKNNPPKSLLIIRPLYLRKRLKQSRHAFYPIKNNEKKGM